MSEAAVPRIEVREPTAARAHKLGLGRGAQHLVEIGREHRYAALRRPLHDAPVMVKRTPVAHQSAKSFREHAAAGLGTKF